MKSQIVNRSSLAGHDLLTTQFYSYGRKTVININDAQGSVPIETGGGGHSLPRCLTWSLANNSINVACYLEFHS